MAPSISLLYILFTVGFLSKYSTGNPHLKLGLHFLEEPKDVIGIKGKSLAFSCKPAKANRPKDSVSVKWYHNNKLMDLTNDKRRTIFQNGTLYFSKLVHKRGGYSDQGEYRCVIVKENGSLSSRPGFLRISVLPDSFSRHPLKQNVEIGSNVRLSCEINLFSEVEIEWAKDNEKLPHNELKYATITGPDVHGSILYIFNVVPDDSGSYRCTARNILLNKQRHSSSGLLTVQPRVGENGLSHNPFTFLSAQRPLSSSFFASIREIKERENVTLDCVTNGFPTPILVWNFMPHGQNIFRPIQNKTSNGHNILRINNITRHQGGWYTCSAMNSVKKEITTEVKVLTMPEIQEKSENIVFRASKTVRFRCVASGNPIPEMHWLKDGSLVNITGRIKHRTSVNESQQLRLSELIISSTVTSDAGIYQCMANNSVGWVWAASRLLLNATRPAPQAPEKVSCVSISSSQIKLTWDVPESLDKILAFSVHYHLTENGEEEQKVLESNSRSTQIDKLLPFTNYTFYVRLYIYSASEFSEKTVCQTGEEVPIEAPKTELNIVSPNSVHVSWIPLPKDKARGIINQYKIQWRIKSSPSARVVEVTSDVLDYTITGLIPGKKYDVRVLAATSKGWPDVDLPWETLEIPLNFNKNLPSAPEVKLLAINSSSIDVKWSPPNRGTEVIGYKIFYRKHNSNRSGPIIVSSEQKEYILTELDPETWYEVMVLGFTKEDEGETGISSVHTLSKEGSLSQLFHDFSSILEPPTFLEANPVSPVAINLSWSSPQVASGSNLNIEYTVCFNPVKTSRNKNATTTCVKSSENKILIPGLNPFTLYEFKVKSHDVNNKQSAFSQTIECYTLEDVPSLVTDISWKALNKSTVQVTWKKPRQSNGIIQNYTLSYTHDSNLPLNSWKVKVVPASNFKTELTDLSCNVKYYLIIRASNSAGLGSFETPQQFLISSPDGISEDESTPKTSKDKQSDHYIGIMVGLGIGMCCIILCTTCILCRRRCLKRHISQEFEVTSSHQTNGNDCRREREIVLESREPEYFTFLSSQRDRLSSMEVTIQHLDTKNFVASESQIFNVEAHVGTKNLIFFQGHYPNGSANGIRMSLLSEGRTLSDNGRVNVCITENPKYDPNSSDSPLLRPKNHSNSQRRCGETLEQFNFIENRRAASKSFRGGKRILCELKKPPASLNNNNFVPEGRTKEKRSSTENGELRSFSQNHVNNNVHNNTDRSEIEKLSEEEQWLSLNSVLNNPEFRFSDSNSDSGKAMQKKNGFVLPEHFYNTTIERNGFKTKSSTKGKEDVKGHDFEGIYAASKLSLQLLTKEITQES